MSKLGAGSMRESDSPIKTPAEGHRQFFASRLKLRLCQRVAVPLSV